MFQLYLRAHIPNIHYIFLIYYIIVNHYYKFILYIYIFIFILIQLKNIYAIYFQILISSLSVNP